MRNVVLVALLLAACRKEDAAPPPAVLGAVPFVAGSDACGKAIDHVVKLQADMMASFPDAEAAKVTRIMNLVGARMAASCREMAWPTEATDCLRATKNVQEAEQCDGKMTADQRAARDRVGQAAVDEVEASSPR